MNSKKPKSTRFIPPSGSKSISLTLPSVLRKWREQTGCSLSLAAKALHVPGGTFAHWEAGHHFPQPGPLKRLLLRLFLGCPRSLKAHSSMPVAPSSAYALSPGTDVKAIRKLRASGGWYSRELAERFGGGRGAVSCAIREITRAHPKRSTFRLAKLSARDVRAIRNRANESYTQLAKEYGVTLGTIARVARKKTWKYLPGKTARRRKPKGENHVNAKLTRYKVKRIRTLWASNEHTFSELAEMFGVTPMTIHGIISGVAWTHVGKNGGRKALFG